MAIVERIKFFIIGLYTALLWEIMHHTGKIPRPLERFHEWIEVRGLKKQVRSLENAERGEKKHD